MLTRGNRIEGRLVAFTELMSIHPADFYHEDWLAIAVASLTAIGGGILILTKYRRRFGRIGPGMGVSLTLQCGIAGAVVGLLLPPSQLEDRVEIGYVLWSLLLLPWIGWIPSVSDRTGGVKLPWWGIAVLSTLALVFLLVACHYGWFRPFRALGLSA